MMEARNSTCFSLEALLQVIATGDMRGKNFDGNFAIEPRIACPIDLAHAARADRRNDLIWPQEGSR